MTSAQEALGSADPEKRRQGVSDIAQAAEREQAALLVRALGDSDWRVRKEAAMVARSLTSRDVLDALVRLLGPGDNVGLRNAAVEALAGFGARAVQALQVAAVELDADGRKLVAEALAASGDAGALAVLEPMLDDADPNVRAAAIEGIAGVGALDVDRATMLLGRCLVGRDDLVVLGALEGLNRLGVAVAWPMLRPHLKNPVLGDAILVAAGLSGHSDAAPHLARALASRQGRPFRAALGALATYIANEPVARKFARAALGVLDEGTRRRLIDAARDTSDDTETRRCALLVVGVLGTADAADAVIEALDDDRMVSEAEEALAMLGPAAILALSRRARTGAPHERAACVEQLGHIADDSSRVIACQAILDATDDGAPEVARAALVALSRIGDEATFGLATRWLGAEAPMATRQAAAQALSACAARYPEAARSLARQIRPDGPDAAVAALIIGALAKSDAAAVAEDVAFLSDAASNESVVARRAAVEALSSFDGPLAVEAVSFALADEAVEVQIAAIRALGKMRDASGNPIGVQHLLDVVRRFDDDALGVSAIEALGGANDASAIEVLRAVAREASARRAVAAIEAIGRIDAPGRIDALVQALSHGEAEVVKAALRALSNEERDARAAAHVGACLDHEVWDVRRLSAELLGRRSDAAGKQLLRQRLVGEREPLVREEIQRALAETEGIPMRRTMPPLPGGMG
ncbi:MAG TPA: HEAT repeat domain-containing protein [Polyangiaceae bacterium]|jgi:HEAT repeat protein|nr:HEAT repeat domain-containing protein [Polyangiaceae bacterium]